MILLSVFFNVITSNQGKSDPVSLLLPHPTIYVKPLWSSCKLLNSFSVESRFKWTKVILILNFPELSKRQKAIQHVVINPLMPIGNKNVTHT